MPLRIGFDLDGVLADMESELVRQSEILFGEVLARRTRDGADAGPVPSAADPGEPAAGSPDAAPDFGPPATRLDMNGRQQRRLWRHVESIENFWEGLDELEPGAIQRLAAIAIDRRWEIIS
jgi:hypothetical protein